MSDAALRKRGPFPTGWRDAIRSLFAGRGGIEPAVRIRERVQRGDLRLADGLEKLRRTAASIRPEGLLLDWGRRQLGLTPAGEAEWFQRAWWGLWAGEMFRDQVHSMARHDDAMTIIDQPSPAVIDRLRTTGQGRILAGAHVGPPHAALAWLLEQKLPLLAWTAAATASFGGAAAGASLVDASCQPNSLTLAAFHLRRGGVFFAAIDGSAAGRLILLRFLNGGVRCSTAIPALARRLELPTERLLALWKGNRITIDCEPVAPAAAGLDEESCNRAWLEACRQPIDEVLRTSPENIRRLRFWSEGAICKEIGL